MAMGDWVGNSVAAPHCVQTFCFVIMRHSEYTMPGTIKHNYNTISIQIVPLVLSLVGPSWPQVLQYRVV